MMSERKETVYVCVCSLECVSAVDGKECVCLCNPHHCYLDELSNT